MPELTNKFAYRPEVGDLRSQVASIINFYKKFNLDSNRSIVVVFMLAVVIRLLFSIISYYFDFPFPKIKIDFDCHNEAIYFIRNSIWSENIRNHLPSKTYSFILVLFYKVFGCSMLVGYLSSLIAFCGSFWGLFNLAKLLKIKPIFFLMLFFSFLPIQIVFTTYALKDSWQLFSLIYSLFFFLRFIIYDKPWNLFLSILMLLFCACLHYYVLPIEAAMLLILIIGTSFTKIFLERKYYLLKYVVFITLVIFVSYKPLINMFGVMKAVTTGQAVVTTPSFGIDLVPVSSSIVTASSIGNNPKKFWHSELLLNKSLWFVVYEYCKSSIKKLRDKGERLLKKDVWNFSASSFIRDISMVAIVQIEHIEKFRDLASIHLLGATSYYQETKIDNFSYKPWWYITYKYIQRYVYFLFYLKFTSWMDYLLLIEKLFYGICFLLYLRYGFVKSFNLSTFLFAFSFFTLSSLWSIGVFNYGTAIRHFVTCNWLLMLMAFQYVDYEELKILTKKPLIFVRKLLI